MSMMGQSELDASMRAVWLGDIDHPAPSGMGFLPIRAFFLTDAANVGQVGVFFHLALDARVVVPLIPLVTS